MHALAEQIARSFRIPIGQMPHLLSELPEKLHHAGLEVEWCLTIRFVQAMRLNTNLLKDRHIALLRGINVGGKNMLPMKELSKMFEQAGCTAVTTYINSGNVAFSASPATLKSLPALVTSQIEKQFGHKVPLVLRSGAQLANAIAANPFPDAMPSPKTLSVLFLRDLPTPAAVSQLDPNRSPGDTYQIIGHEIYCYTPNGQADTKLTNAYFDSKLATVSTGRNWATVLKLYAMTGEVAL